MAKAKGKSISSQINKISRKLKMQASAIKEFANTVPEQIANESLEVARSTLAAAINLNDFTQKHEMSLVHEIGVKRTTSKKGDISKGNAYKVYAPVSGDNEIAYEMYFAEYGAGIGAAMNPHPPTPIADLHYTDTKVDIDGYWYYRLIYPKIKTDTLGRLRKKSYNRVNTSRAVNYMWSARTYARTRLKAYKRGLIKELNVKVGTSIKHGKK